MLGMRRIRSVTAGTEGQRHEGIQGIVAPGLEPPVGGRRMIGESDAVEAGGFGGPGEPVTASRS